MVLDTVMYIVHTAFAALWSGSVLFVAAAVLPLAMDGDLAPEAFGSIVSKLQWVTRGSAALLFISGGHLAGTLYDVESLTGSGNGHLVLAMLALWLGLAAVVEIGSAKAHRGVDENKIREPARAARPFYLVGAVFAAGLLLVAGLLGVGSRYGLPF
ncbi:transporter [Natronomonas amylolytica]|uniref:transporter n=1 Tax=Natronomonas amylolytica TaxID=3108498 RepID=UPI0030092CDA